MSNAYKDLFSNGGCTELNGENCLDSLYGRNQRKSKRHVNDNIDITVRVSCEDTDYFTMNVSDKELRTIMKFISELNASSNVSIKIIDIE